MEHFNHARSSSGTTKMRVAERRNKQSHHAILQATLALLESDGYRSLTIEGIASKAGVGKTTIYRWWPSKAAVALEAFTEQAAVMVPIPDEGSLRADLNRFFSRAFQVLNSSTGTLVRSLMAEAQFDSTFAQTFRTTFINARRNALMALFQRGIQRGEVSARSDLEFLADMLYGPMWYRLLNQHAPLDDVFVEHLVDFVLGQTPPFRGEDREAFSTMCLKTYEDMHEHEESAKGTNE